MRVDLRDYFAAKFAAALVQEQRFSIDFIVGRAYDVADAMMAERERRLEAEESRSVSSLPEDASWADARAELGGLLDQVSPPSDADPALADDDERLVDPAWLEERDDPAWEAGEKFSLQAPRPESARPGLARTKADEEAEKARRRSA